jgi:hypothetical protein
MTDVGAGQNTVQNTTGDDLSAGRIEFVESFVPPLESGLYEVKVEQVLQHTAQTDEHGQVQPLSADDPAYINEVFVNTSRFAVLGERFGLDPSEVANQFPPPGGTGEYDNVLPHIVLHRKTLPWERTADGKQAPWLAVLVFDEADPPPQLQTVLVGDLQRAPFAGSAADDGKAPQLSQLPDDVASVADLAPLVQVTFELDLGQRWSDPVQVIDVPVALFAEVAPTVAELSWLVHGRTVPLANKPGAGLPESGSFSVVVANRLPAPNSRAVAYLVSLEALAGALPVTGGPPRTITTRAGLPAAKVRLVSLASWEFTSVDPLQSFAGLLKRVKVFPAAAQPGVDGQGTTADRAVSDAMAMGYWPLDHSFRDGSTTVSWYRGPFAPLPLTGGPQVPIPGAGGPLADADDALRYDPTSGMFDVSYAGAFELGRVSGLSSGSFSTSLYAWKRTNTQKAALAAEAQILGEQLGQTLDLEARPLRAAAALMANTVGPRLTARATAGASATGAAGASAPGEPMPGTGTAAP